MKILITNNSLVSRTGSELYVIEIGEKLRKRGHLVAAYSNHVDELAVNMRQAGIEVIDDLTRLSWTPDIIHGQHHLETMTAIAHFPDVPVFYLCHGWRPWQEKCPVHPRILKYGAVDTMTLDFSVENGIPEDRISLIYNFVDLERFSQRESLPPKPEKALVFSNYAAESNYLPTVTQACQRAGIELDAVGALHGNMTDSPDRILRDYDLIFAKGRCSLEALATGAALIICDEVGVGPMVTTANMEKLRDQNFGVAAMYSQMDADVISQEISNYDAGDAAEVTAKLRTVIGIDRAVEEIENVYRETLEIFENSPVDEAEANHALSSYLRDISLFIKSNEVDHLNRAQMIVEMERIMELKEEEISLLREQNYHTEQDLTRIASEYEAVLSSRFWKLRNACDAIRRVTRR